MIIYYDAVGNERILLLDIYPKNEKADITVEELKNLQDVLLVWLEKIR